VPIAVAARFKARFAAACFAGIAGLNPVGGIGVCCDVVCCQVEVSATGRCLVQSSPIRLCVCVCV
jgi:hypothetical protein